MNILSIPQLRNSAAALAAVFIAIPSFAQTSAAPANAKVDKTAEKPADAKLSTAAVATDATASAQQPNDAEMMAKMMELSKLNENHKLLATLDGTWNCDVKMWMDGDTSKKPDVSKSTAVRKSIMDGRYVIMDVTGKMEMPGPDGKKKEMTFKGHGTEGYDNVKKKFVGTWMDSMGTGIMMSEGDYDSSTKTFTYTGEFEMMPGMKQKIREVLKITDKDHMNFEYYEDRGGKEMKTMEIAYTRSGKK
jgi:hypothetical protein